MLKLMHYEETYRAYGTVHAPSSREAVTPNACARFGYSHAYRLTSLPRLACLVQSHESKSCQCTHAANTAMRSSNGAHNRNVTVRLWVSL